MTHARLTPTYNDFPSLPWEIGMPEMVEAYRQDRAKPYYTDEAALRIASAIYNSARDHYLRGLWSLPTEVRGDHEARRLAADRDRLEELGAMSADETLVDEPVEEGVATTLDGTADFDLEAELDAICESVWSGNETMGHARVTERTCTGERGV